MIRRPPRSTLFPYTPLSRSAEAEERDATDEPDEPQIQTAREDLAELCTAARNAEMEARLEVRTAEERLRAIGGRAESLAAAAAAERATRPRAAERRQRRATPAPLARAGALGARDAGGAAPPSRFERTAAERRAADAQRQLDRLGKVNPLALEEFEALTERHTFLATQLDDLRKTRRDLLTVVKEVDDRVQEVFASAYADTAREFEHLFSRLFPGGQGNLVLTEPDDMLATGIEIEARPPGKKVKRLSLLSGGERSLTAIAYLFAIFKARPSPFYVLDEAEAALDDTNLQRLLP